MTIANVWHQSLINLWQNERWRWEYRYIIWVSDPTWTAPSRTTDRLSTVRLLMGKKPYSGTADSGAAVARPNTETAGRLGIELAYSSLVHQCCNTWVFKLSHCFVTQSSPGPHICKEGRYQISEKKISDALRLGVWEPAKVSSFRTRPPGIPVLKVKNSPPPA